MKYFMIFFTGLIMVSCASNIKVSKYAKYGKEELGAVQTYYNDSLKFSMDFFGMHTLRSKSESKPFLPKASRNLFSKYGVKNKLSFLFAYKARDKSFGYDSYCYIPDDKKILLDSGAFIFLRDANNSFYSKNITSDSKNYYMLSGCVLNSKYLFFVNTQPIIQTIKQDLQVNVSDELATFKNSVSYK